MLKFILFETTMFASGDNVEKTRQDLVWLLESLTQRDQDFLLMRPETPRLYKSGVVYKMPAQFAGECPEVSTLRDALGKSADRRDVATVLETVQEALGGERFRDIGRIIENGGGDCDNVACWRAAELRQAGIQASPYMTSRTRPDGGTTYHALVLWPPFANVKYRTSEDPSLLLGMGGEARAADRAEEIRKNQERCELLQKYGIAPVDKRAAAATLAPASFAEEIETVLGLKRVAPAPSATAFDLDTLVKGLQ